MAERTLNVETIEPLVGELISPPSTDRFTVRLVVSFLGILALVGLIFVGLLALDDKQTPDSLVAIASGAVGALGAMLAKTSTS